MVYGEEDDGTISLMMILMLRMMTICCVIWDACVPFIALSCVLQA